MRQFDLKRIENAFDWLQKEFEDTDVLQSIDVLIQRQAALNSVIAWAYEQQAIAGKLLNEAKQQAYIALNAKAVTQKQLFAPSLAKDFISASCHEENYKYDLVERLCRATIHVSDNLRTSISALKEQAKMESYNQSVPNF